MNFLMALGRAANAANMQAQLHYAAQSGQEQLVANLLQHGVNANSRDGYNRTALHWAAELGHAGICRLLIEKEVDIEAQGGVGWTALHCAAYAGHLNIVQLLLDRGARIQATDFSGQTPYIVAASNGKVAVMQLIQQKAVPQVPQYNGFLQAPQFNQSIARPISAPPIMNNANYYSSMAALGNQITNQNIQQMQNAAFAQRMRNSQDFNNNMIRVRREGYQNFMNAEFPDQSPYLRRYDDYSGW